MARSRFAVTSTWTQVNAGQPCIVTIDFVNRDTFIEFNDVADDATAVRLVPNVNDQVEQLEAKPLFVRSPLPGFQLIVDVQGA